MDLVRSVAADMADRQLIDVLQRGEFLSGRDWHGPVRLRSCAETDTRWHSSRTHSERECPRSPNTRVILTGLSRVTVGPKPSGSVDSWGVRERYRTATMAHR